MSNLINPNTPITILRRLTTAQIKNLTHLAIQTVQDLLFHLPFRYEDFSRLVPISQLRVGEEATVNAQLLMIQNRRTPRKGRLLTEALFRDETGTLKVIWWNQSYLPKILKTGMRVYLAGRLEEDLYGAQMVNPIFEFAVARDQAVHTGRLIPLYHTSGTLTSRLLRDLVGRAISAATTIGEWLPAEVRRRQKLLTLPEAIRLAHFPKTMADVARARGRLAFGELFMAGLSAESARRELDRQKAPPILWQEAATKNFIKKLPFTLTESQRRAAWEILQDLGKGRPMNRLLEGDVGSGKTVVAAIAILNVILRGYKVLYLAPTEILARQQVEVFRNLFRSFSVRDALLTSKEKLKISQSELDLICGTHALLNEKLVFDRVGLVIVDEQHRFGVEQRQAIKSRAQGSGSYPHLLSMTATPIPRTLTLTLYGDLDLSMLTELPPRRKLITTRLIEPNKRTATYTHIRQELKSGRQGFVICPTIEESDKLGVRAATVTHEELKKIFPEFSLGLLHGKLKAVEKQKTMEAFAQGKIALLVTTSVVEVGINVPNATVMIIEGAERFGLAQLHQFRGRIGRSALASSCFLFTDTVREDALARLAFFAQTHDGFLLAERDLEIRGPGELFGTIQSGFPAFKVADLRDRHLVKAAHGEARALLRSDPDLEHYPVIAQKLAGLLKEVHLE